MTLHESGSDNGRIRWLWIGLGTYFLIFLNAGRYIRVVPYQVSIAGALINIGVITAFVVALVESIQKPETAEFRGVSVDSADRRERRSSSRLGGADRDRDRPCRFRWCNDVALAVKNPAWLDHQAMRMDLARGNSPIVDLHFSFCEDYTVEMA